MSDPALEAAVEEIAEEYCNKPVPRSQAAILLWREKFAKDKADIKSIILKHFPPRPKPKGLGEAVGKISTYISDAREHNFNTDPYEIKSILLAHLPLLDEGCTTIPAKWINGLWEILEGWRMDPENAFYDEYTLDNVINEFLDRYEGDKNQERKDIKILPDNCMAVSEKKLKHAIDMLETTSKVLRDELLSKAALDALDERGGE